MAKFRRKLKKGETLISVFRETYRETYDRQYKKALDSMQKTPDVIKNLPATSGTQLVVIGSIALFAVMIILSNSGLNDIKNQITDIRTQASEIESQLEERESIYFSADGWKQADKSASEITDILNKIQSVTGNLQEETKELEKLAPYFTYKASSAAGINWGSMYDTDYSWSYYVDKASVDEDLISIVFILKKQGSSKPNKIVFTDYSLLLSQIIDKKEWDIA